MSSITKRSKYEIDMCNGTIMDKLILIFVTVDVIRNPAIDV